ncbi:MAG: ATP-binding protein [Angelakisella sp.]
MFTYPFWSFDMSITGYPLTFVVMLVVSVVISTLTTRVKQTERLRYEIESEKLRADLLRALSHDLRTPLASIEGADSLLLEQPDLSEAERRTLLEQIRQETRWLTRITENMLSVTRMAGEQVSLHRTDEVVEEIVDSAVMKLRRSRNALPVTVIRPKEILTAPMDATLMEQVILNLLENAVNHAEGATRIRVEIAGQGDTVMIAVEDDGAGFPPELLPQLFDRKLLPQPRSCADGRRGLGLGLTLCSAIIKHTAAA